MEMFFFLDIWLIFSTKALEFWVNTRLIDASKIKMKAVIQSSQSEAPQLESLENKYFKRFTCNLFFW